MAPVGDGVGDGVGLVLLDESAIRAEVARLALQISADYADKSLHLVGVLKGAAVFLADLLRALTVPATLDFISIVPYGQVTASGVVRIRKDLDEPLEGKDVLVVEGICASGLSLSYLLRNFQTRRPASLRTCAFVVKRRERPADVTLHYFGREIPDVFVVGYGLDAQEQYRNLPYIARLA
jgi:hypoxanthine phosphoribosyltransferase